LTAPLRSVSGPPLTHTRSHKHNQAVSSRVSMLPLILVCGSSLSLHAPLRFPAPAPAFAPARSAAPAATLAHARASLSRDVSDKVAAAMLAAFVAFAPCQDAEAARVGGRVGGRAPVSRSMAPRAPARRTTNIYVAPTPVYGGYGYGGFGYSPFGGGISPGAYLGLSLVETLVREQQRQAYLQQQLRTQQQLGADQAMIQQLQADLAAQNAKVEGLKLQQQSPGTAPVPAPPTDSGSVQLLQQQLLEQQKEIEALKAAAK